MSYARRVDKNQAEIVKALREVFCSVLILSRLGQGKPDILAGRDGRNVLFEIKNEDGKDDLKNAAQNEFAATWLGEIYTVHTAAEAVGIMLCPKRSR